MSRKNIASLKSRAVHEQCRIYLEINDDQSPDGVGNLDVHPLPILVFDLIQATSHQQSTLVSSCKSIASLLLPSKFCDRKMSYSMVLKISTRNLK